MFVDFLSQLLSWQNVVSNLFWTAVFTTLLRALTWLFHKNPRREIWFWVVVPLLVLALWSAATFLTTGWREPRLSTSIDVINCHAMPRELASKFSVPADSTSVVLVVSLRNSGMPTVAEGWSLAATLPNGESAKGTPLFLPDKLTLSGPTGEIAYQGTDALYDKAIKGPIVFGGMVRGVLWFAFPSVPIDAFNQPGTTLVLSCVDVLGKKHSAVRKIGAFSGSPRYLPGLESPK